jgi:HSP20 family molecular chaperone IbpA
MALSTHSILPSSIFGDEDFLKFFVGIDNQLDAIQKTRDTISKSQTKYPPYNIKSMGDTDYMIEIAVAGFKQEDLDVQLQNRTLTVTGKAPEETIVPIHKGIATRAFTSTFSLAERVETTGVLLQDGLLKIYLQYIVPEEMKPKTLEINSSLSKMLLG